MTKSEKAEFERLRATVDRMQKEIEILTEQKIRQEATISMLEGKNNALLDIVERALNAGRSSLRYTQNG